MGLSAKDSRIFLINPTCPIKLNGTPPTDSSTSHEFSEQVTRIELTPSVFERKYGHDKSEGWQDVTAGTKSCDGSITTKVADGSKPFTLSAGDVAFIRVWPIGPECGHKIQGYASITSDPIVMNLENGEPVEHNYRFSSKGKWTGLPGSAVWGGFECQCGNGPGGSGGDVPAVAGAVGWSELTVPKVPVIGHQWDSKAWAEVYNECVEGFTAGPAPTEPGHYQGELVFVDCQVEG